MKKTKIFIILLMVFTVLLFNKTNIKAAEIPSAITMGKPQEVWNEYNEPNGYTHMPYKSTNDGIPTFCTSFLLLEPAQGTVCTKIDNAWSDPISAGIAAIIKEANVQPNASSTNLNYYYAEIAINRFLYEHINNELNRVHQGLTTRQLLGNYYTYFEKAEEAYEKVDSFNEGVEVTLTRTSGKNSFNLNSDDANNVVNTYKISGNADSYKVTSQFINQSSDSITAFILDENNNPIDENHIFYNGDSFKVKITGVEAGNSAQIKINVVGTVKYDKAIQYNCGTSVQPVTLNIYNEKQKTGKTQTQFSVRKKDYEPDYPSLVIKKEDSNHNTLPGVEISITKDNQVFEKLYTTTGQLEINDLEAGKYCIQETKAPDGYLINSNQYCFNVNIEGNNVTVIPQDAYFNVSNTTPKVITFTLPNNPNKIRISKKDKNGNYISGVKLKILDKDKHDAKNVFGEPIGEITTGDSAIILKNIAAGTYYVREIEAPNGYAINDYDVRFVVKKNKTFESENGLLSADVVVENEKTVLNISKKDITDKTELKGATLRILDENCENVVKLNNENLEWVSNGSTHTIEGLSAGNYCLEETSAPNGYKLMTEKIKFSINEYGLVTVNNETSKTATVVMNNEPYKVYISKKSLTSGDEIEGAHLQLLDKDGKIVEEWDSTTTPHLIEVKLPVGTYTLKETIAPNGYVLSTDTITFTIDKYGVVKVDNTVAKDSIITMTNDYTKVYISKQDITNKQELPGAHLILKDQDGNIVKDGDWVSTNEPHLIEGLGKGTYTLTEITAPDGYLLNEETITFTIDENGAISGDTVMYNTPTPEIPPTEVPTPDVPATSAFQSVLFVLIGVVLVGSGVGLYIYGIKKKKEI